MRPGSWTVLGCVAGGSRSAFTFYCFPPSFFHLQGRRMHNPLFRLLMKSGKTRKLFSRQQLISTCNKIVLKFSCLDLPASLPFPSLHSPPTLIKLACPSQALKERKPTNQKAFPRPLCLAYQAKLPNKQVRLCRSLPKIRVLFSPCILHPFCTSALQVQMSKPVRNHGGGERNYDRPYPGDSRGGQGQVRDFRCDFLDNGTVFQVQVPVS